MEEIILSEILESVDSEAADLLLDYLQREHLQLSREEWLRTLEDLLVSDSPKLTARAEALAVLLPEDCCPDREPFAMPPCVRVYLTAKNLKVKMTPREWDVLHYRNGFADGSLHTLTETGEQFGVSHKRILQVEQKALRRCRSHVNHMRRNLRDFYQ